MTAVVAATKDKLMYSGELRLERIYSGDVKEVQKNNCAGEKKKQKKKKNNKTKKKKKGPIREMLDISRIDIC